MDRITSQQLLTRLTLSQLESASVFGALPEASILWLLDHGVIRNFNAGDELFSPDQAGNSFHVILQGSVDYYKFHDGRYAYIRTFNSGEQIGFVSMIALHDRVGRAEACEAGISLEINSETFHDFHLSYPLEFGILMMNLAREMARTLRKTNNILVDRS
ncbi:cyclic nucleotide-binding domain-containing protein [Amphritea sp. 2_MG-2023]|jgi:CRP-like cAMP-binding protein|uniref:Crp/Fnr family transcriptional regulator n=1 Tax=Amphritea TaxID=515417 RepID=UPI001C077FE3|nr:MULTISPECIES: cyclic nucleotide-binding domain-containing protein [Amphritea]MBU2965301.1 cyclic nucleotide-binding domain-containing protein [Amphritea atlantica]MDO6420164.1 cyclic nucleotide-binding domain-containing protein [Amphritea sp. 2_MG-2023]